MKIKERAAYAWTRIVDLFKPKKPEIEVEIEEMDEEVQESASAACPEAMHALEPEDVAESQVPDRMGEEEAVPSRMTEEYKAWLKEQLASEEESGPDGQ